MEVAFTNLVQFILANGLSHIKPVCATHVFSGSSYATSAPKCLSVSCGVRRFSAGSFYAFTCRLEMKPSKAFDYKHVFRLLTQPPGEERALPIKVDYGTAYAVCGFYRRG